MNNMHVCYMDGGSIINSYTGGIIEDPAILVSASDDILHGWGSMENVEAKFTKFAHGYSQAGMEQELNDLMLIELSQYRIGREMACYVMRRAAEFMATGFIRDLCGRLKSGDDPIRWLEQEMERVPIDLYEKEWR